MRDLCNPIPKRAISNCAGVAVCALLAASCSSEDTSPGFSRLPDASIEATGDCCLEDGSMDHAEAGFADTASIPDADPDADAFEPPATRTRYPSSARHSPMSSFVIGKMTEVLSGSQGQPNVFAKLGDSITVNSNFLGCFSGADVQWDASGSLEPSRAFFGQALVDGTHSSFNRPSLAATVGWSAKALLSGSPTPLDQEFNAIHPAFAVIMFGTNDTYETGVHPFERALRADLDAVLARGAVPLVSTIPPRKDPTANALVPEMNAIIRALAQARQVPLMDYWSLLTGLADYGLASDGVHPEVYVSGGVHGCWFTATALQEGMNARNLISMEALDRARRFLLEHEPAEPAPPALQGEGTLGSPWVIPELPFSDDADTVQGHAELVGYNCSPADEAGPERVYRIELDAPRKLRARVFCDDGVDIDLYWLEGDSASQCVSRADRTLDIQAGPGTFYLVADSYVESGKVLSGGYRLTLVEVP